jgi:ubiquinone/menaquinone biosynthesis C-methylase UbiE
VRAGKQAHGIDLTPEAIAHVKARLALENRSAQELRVADAENLPYPDNSFDLVYSWGVIHHSPDTPKCLAEIVRVTRPGGTIKLMIYNRYSVWALSRWIRYALLRGKPFQSIARVLCEHQESYGTKAYTMREVRTMLKKHPVRIHSLQAPIRKPDLFIHRRSPHVIAYLAACLFGWYRVGWYMLIELEKNA